MTSIDFLPADYVCVQTRRLQARWRRLSLVILTSLVAYGAVNESYRQMQAEQIRLAVNNRLRSLMHQLPNTRALQRRLQAAATEADKLAAVELSVRPSRILTTLTAALPAGTRLTELSLKFDSAPPFESPLTELADRDDPQPGLIPSTAPSRPDELDRLHVMVQGTAGSDELVAELLNKLEASSLFTHVHLRHIEQHVGTGERQFHLDLTVDPPELSTHALSGVTVRVVGDDEPALNLPESIQPGRTP